MRSAHPSLALPILLVVLAAAAPPLWGADPYLSVSVDVGMEGGPVAMGVGGPLRDWYGYFYNFFSVPIRVEWYPGLPLILSGGATGVMKGFVFNTAGLIPEAGVELILYNDDLITHSVGVQGRWFMLEYDVMLLDDVGGDYSFDDVRHQGTINDTEYRIGYYFRTLLDGSMDQQIRAHAELSFERKNITDIQAIRTAPNTYSTPVTVVDTAETTGFVVGFGGLMKVIDFDLAIGRAKGMMWISLRMGMALML
ncbi:MAG: hypothetical protein NT080_08725 [Spirochaetes bacterium]|nr:hypothetical protein [Spirochaetota bacterium]